MLPVQPLPQPVLPPPLAWSPTRNNPIVQFTGHGHLAIAVGSEAAVDALTARLHTDGYPVLDGRRRTGDGYDESVVRTPMATGLS